MNKFWYHDFYGQAQPTALGQALLLAFTAALLVLAARLVAVLG